MSDLNERVQARLNLLTGSRPSLKALDADDHARWLWDAVDSRVLAVLVTSWRERVERHEPEAAEYPQCGWCFNMYGSPLAWPCADYLSVCREIGVEL